MERRLNLFLTRKENTQLAFHREALSPLVIMSSGSHGNGAQASWSLFTHLKYRQQSTKTTVFVTPSSWAIFKYLHKNLQVLTVRERSLAYSYLWSVFVGVFVDCVQFWILCQATPRSLEWCATPGIGPAVVALCQPVSLAVASRMCTIDSHVQDRSQTG